MAKQSARPSPKMSPTAPRASAMISSTAPRGSAIPRPEPAAKPAPKCAITHDMIAQRAYEIWRSGQGGSEFENWCRAEQELQSAGL